MELDLDTFLVTVYCQVADLYQAHFASQKPRRPGAKPELSDSEVLALMLLGQWEPRRSERAFLSYVRKHWRSYFPRLLSQSAFNRRARDLWGVLCQLCPLLAASWEASEVCADAYEAMDGVPVPLMRRCRGNRHRLFANEAAIGRGGADREWYYGVKLVASISPRRGLTGFVFGPANTEEHWLAEALFRWRADPQAPPPSAPELAPVLGPAHRLHGGRRGPSGPLSAPLAVGTPSAVPSLADLGYRGEAWTQHWREAYDAWVLMKAAYPTTAGRAWFNGLRQCVETTFGCLIDIFGLKFPRARTAWGLLTRVAAKMSAFNMALWINHRFGRPTFAIFNPLA
jgi:hypothetical protein